MSDLAGLNLDSASQVRDLRWGLHTPRADVIRRARQKELQQFIETEQAHARVQTQVHTLTSLCWDKYVFSPLLLALSRSQCPHPSSV